MGLAVGLAVGLGVGDLLGLDVVGCNVISIANEAFKMRTSGSTVDIKMLWADSPHQ